MKEKVPPTKGQDIVVFSKRQVSVEAFSILA